MNVSVNPTVNPGPNLSSAIHNAVGIVIDYFAFWTFASSPSKLPRISFSNTFAQCKKKNVYVPGESHVMSDGIVSHLHTPIRKLFPLSVNGAQRLF